MATAPLAEQLLRWATSLLRKQNGRGAYNTRRIPCVRRESPSDAVQLLPTEMVTERRYDNGYG